MWLVFFPVYSRFECTPVDRCVWFAVAEQQCALRLETISQEQFAIKFNCHELSR